MGHHSYSASVTSLERVNPANFRAVVARYEEATERELEAAIEAVADASRTWKGMGPLSRAEAVARYLDEIERMREALAEVVVLENGKPLAEARTEVDRAIHGARYQLDLFVEFERARKAKADPFSRMSWEQREPLGLVLLIVPWNFPVSVVLRKLIPALLCGNGVLIKPAELTPLSAPLMMQAAAGLPLLNRVVSVLRGRGPVIGDRLVRDPRIRGISFTGSTTVGLGIQAAVAARDVAVQLEMGGKNATVVLKGAPLAETARQLIQSAFTCSGQWCLATSRLIVERSVAGELRTELLRAGESIIIGDGLDPRVTMGPLVSAEQLRKVGAFQADARGRLDVVELGSETGNSSGGYFAPAMIAFDVERDDPIAREEVFGPLLAVIEADDLDDAVDINNGVQYGLASSIYTRDIAAARSFVERSETGKVSVNLGTGFNDPSLPLGGRRESGRGLPENGQSGLMFFSRHKSVYVGDIDA